MDAVLATGWAQLVRPVVAAAPRWRSSSSDLKATSDFRSVYASMLTHVLGADADRVLDGYHQQTDHLFA